MSTKTFRLTAALLCLVGLAVSASVEEMRVESTAVLIRRSGEESLREAAALREVTGLNTYITSATVSPHDTSAIIVATTFHGLYESVDGGATWRDLTEDGATRSLHLGEGFYEDISAAAYDLTDGRIIWVEYAQDRSVRAVSRRDGSIVDLPAERGVAALERATRAPAVERIADSPARRERRRLAADHVSFYLSPQQVEPTALASHMAFAAERGMTAVVVDFKDDFGRLAYDSQLELHRRVGSVRALFDARRVIDTIQSHDLYVIARIVVFQDPMLYRYDNNRYAVWDRRREAPWGVFRQTRDEETGETHSRQVEFWVDPFSEFVWDYNIAIARELEELGVDEIQFDYIRTPADGRVGDIVFRHRADSPALVNDDPFRDDRVEAISMFLRRARTQIDIPIGIDVFGFNGWYRMSYLGQDIALLARYVDVISPMLYPSHFPRGFVGHLPYLEWAEYIYREAVARGRRITGDTVLIRPYIQAFLIGGELEFNEDVYTDYLKRQIRGSLDAGASGFSLWNASGRYYMVSRGLYY